MKSKICLILVFLFSIIGIGAFPLNGSNDCFANLEDEVNDISQFCENGIKIEWQSQNSVKNELNRLNEIIKNNYNNNSIQILDEEIIVKTNDINLQVRAFEDSSNTKVEIIAINKNSSISTDELMNKLNKYENDDCSKVRYFKYLKGEINNIGEGLNLLESTSEAKNVNTLEVHNGYISTANLKSGERVNISLSSYTSGTYVIIGTPIIFATY